MRRSVRPRRSLGTGSKSALGPPPNGPPASAAATPAATPDAAGHGAGPPARERHYQAVAVAASVMPWASSQRSASMAALQPSPAAVTAWR